MLKDSSSHQVSHAAVSHKHHSLCATRLPACPQVVPACPTMRPSLQSGSSEHVMEPQVGVSHMPHSCSGQCLRVCPAIEPHAMGTRSPDIDHLVIHLGTATPDTAPCVIIHSSGTRHRGGSAGLVSGLGGRPLPPLFEEEDGEDEGGGPGRGGKSGGAHACHCQLLNLLGVCMHQASGQRQYTAANAT
jgi:hypothetical protein